LREKNLPKLRGVVLGDENKLEKIKEERVEEEKGKNSGKSKTM
jgi:hypothetical protein